MTGWVCQWKPFWIPVDDSFKKAYVDDWVFQIADTSDSTLPGGQGYIIPETPRLTLPVPSSQREAPKPEISASAPEHIEAPLPLLRSRPTCERLEQPFSDDDVLSGFEDHHLPRSDQFTTWGKMTSGKLAEHVVTFTELRQTSVTPLKEFRLPLLSHMASTNTFLLSLLCEGGLVFTTGILGLDEAQKMLSRNTLQESGTSSPCKKLLTNRKSCMNTFM